MEDFKEAMMEFMKIYNKLLENIWGEKFSTQHKMAVLELDKQKWRGFLYFCWDRQ